MTPFKMLKRTLKLLPITLGVLTIILTACVAHRPEANVEAIEVLSFNLQFNNTLLNLIESNKVEKAKGMLEIRTLLGLKDVWQMAGDAGLITNRACHEAFQEIYPTLRKQVSLSRFHNLPLAGRQSLTNFVRVADRIFLTNDQSLDTRTK